MGNHRQPTGAGGGAQSGHHADHPEGAPAASATSCPAGPTVAVVKWAESCRFSLKLFCEASVKHM